MGLIEGLVLAGVTGLVSATATVVAIRTDVNWIKDSLKGLDKRVNKLEEKIV